MNILVVSSKYPPEYAGSALRAHNTYKRLAKRFRLQVKVLASSVSHNRSKSYEWEGVSVKLIANKWHRRFTLKESDTSGKRIAKRICNKLFSFRNYLFEALPTFLYLIRNQGWYDVIHIFGNVNVTSAAISYAKITKKPIIIELVNLVNNPYQYEPMLVSALWGKGFPKQALIVCISEKLKEVCHKYGYTDRDIWCRPNPIDENKFHFERNKRHLYRRKMTQFQDSDTLILHLAKFMPRKNQLFLLDVMLFLPDSFKLFLAGPLVSSGPLFRRDRKYYETILKTIQEKGLESRVRVVAGFIENPEEYIKACDVFVLPSVREALGTPVLEALACGVPVVANDIPEVFDQWIKDGINGYVCELEPEEWAKKIKQACKIDNSSLKQSSKDILDIASTDKIDREYFRRLNILRSRGRQK